MYCVVETIEKDVVEVSAAPKLWIEEDKLFWPNGSANRKKPSKKKDNWKMYDFRMLEDSISTFEEALVREKFYSNQEISGYEAEKTDCNVMKRQTNESKHSESEADESNSKKMRTQEQLTIDDEDEDVRNKDNHDEKLSLDRNSIKSKMRSKLTKIAVSETKPIAALKSKNLKMLSVEKGKDIQEKGDKDEKLAEMISLPSPFLEIEDETMNSSSQCVQVPDFEDEMENVLRLRPDGNCNVSSIKSMNQVNQEINQHVVQGNINYSEKENCSLSLMLAIHKEMLEIKALCATERSERMNMEARMQSNVDTLMASVSNTSRPPFVKNDQIDNPIMENLERSKLIPFSKKNQNSADTSISTVAQICKEKELTQTITDLTDDSYKVVHVENVTRKCASESESDSESEYDPDWMNANDVANMDQQKSNSLDTVPQFESDPHSKSDLDSESDPESDPESIPLLSKPKPDSQAIKLSLVGDNFYDEEGFMYSKNNIGPNNTLYLRCKNSVKHQCYARAKVTNGDLENGVLTVPHRHKSQKKFIDKAKFYIKLDQNCRLDPFEKPQKLYLQSKTEIRHLVDEGHIPTFKQSTSFIRSRLEEYVPPLPKTIEEFEAFIAQDRYQKKFGVDTRNLPFFRGVWTSTVGERSIVFISETVLKLINTMNNIALFMDGTFKALPYHIKFRQLYVINFIYKNQCYPLAYILMEKKTFTAYDAIFTNLKLLMPSVDVAKLMTDYEPATRKSLRINYPNARLSGCWFHYVQAIYKNAKRFGLLDEPKFKKAIQEVAVLALLPNEFVVPGFNVIDEKFQRKKSQRWNKFRNYWRNQWASANISVYALVDRTNNFSESSNKTLNSLLKVPNPTIWELVNTLRTIEMDKSDDIIKSSKGQMKATQKNLNMIRLNQKIEMATKLFEQTQDIGSFLQNVTYDEDLEIHVKDHLDIDEEEDEYDEIVIPNSLNIESDFRQRHPREATRPK